MDKEAVARDSVTEGVRVWSEAREGELLAACAQIEQEQEAERLRSLVAGLVRAGSRHPQVEALARTFHEIYERLAPGFEHKTREASAKPWGEVPEKNRHLMIATCTELLARRVVVWNGGMSGTWKAKDLPTGSVVADGETSWIKGDSWRWVGTWLWGSNSDEEIDKELAKGAKVLRVGYGE